ncbi:metallophosphoesterase family protein [Rhodospirillaceae bacterium SYSU D60014]|uniref:metallophosphoesterase family protein n=1 Tax=Virgifigura deserti TaxID=2268457 RepID=UPI000E66E388
MTVFFTSDTHFGHGGALGLFGRPFASVAEMDAELIRRWNDSVGPEDDVWHLGDFAIRQRAGRMAEILEALAGRKHLVVGNNDGEVTTSLPGWASVQPYAEIMLDDTRLVLCHYPFRSWNGMGKGAVNLHGHSHGRMAPLPRQADVGVDLWDFRPVTLAQLRLGRRRKAR